MQILQTIEKDALTMDQLKKLVGANIANTCRWLTWDELTKFDTAEDLMSLGAVVILLQIETRHAPSVGHFILLLDQGNHYEHFDSYGLTMEEELGITQEHHLTRIFDRYRKRLINNTVKLQTLRQDVNTCGRWVVARLMLKKLILDDFLKLIKYYGKHTDDTVALMTMLLNYRD